MRTETEERDLAENYVRHDGIWVHKDSLKPAAPQPPIAPKAAPAPAAAPAAAPFVSKYWKPEFIAKYGDRTITWKKLDGILADFWAALEAAIEKAVTNPVGERLKALDERIGELEKELKAGGPNLAHAYKGAWMYGAYKRGSLVTHSGSIFLALKDTDEKPATSDAWKLVVKAGRDGKDAR